MTTRRLVGVRLRDVPKLNASASNLPLVAESLREAAQTLLGYRGDPLDRALTLRDLDEVSQRAVLAGASIGAGGVNTTIVSGGGGGGGPAPGEDLTPPPTAEGLVVTAGVTYLYVSCDAPVYPQGNGHDLTVVYGAKWATDDPTPPTFAEAVEIFRFDGTFGAYPTDTSTRWCVWIKWKTRDNVLSTSPAGGTNGQQATTGLLNGSQLVPGSVDSLRIASVSADKITAGSLSVGQYIQSTGFTPGNPGFRIDGDGGFEVRSVGNTRILSINASGVQPVLKVGSALEILANGTATFGGVINATGGNFSGAINSSATITGGALVGGTITGSVVRTSTTGQRVSLNEASSNELRAYDSTGTLVASVGISSVGGDIVVSSFGLLTGVNRVGVLGQSNTNRGLWGRSNSGIGVDGDSSSGTGVRGASNLSFGVQGISSSASGVAGTTSGSSPNVAGVYGLSNNSTSPAILGVATAAGHGGHFTGNATRSALFLSPVGTAPVNTTSGSMAFISTPYGAVPCWANGSSWLRFTDGQAWNYVYPTDPP